MDGPPRSTAGLTSINARFGSYNSNPYADPANLPSEVPTASSTPQGLSSTDRSFFTSPTSTAREYTSHPSQTTPPSTAISSPFAPLPSASSLSPKSQVQVLQAQLATTQEECAHLRRRLSVTDKQWQETRTRWSDEREQLLRDAHDMRVRAQASELRLAELTARADDTFSPSDASVELDQCARVALLRAQLVEAQRALSRAETAIHERQMQNSENPKTAKAPSRTVTTRTPPGDFTESSAEEYSDSGATGHPSHEREKLHNTHAQGNLCERCPHLANCVNELEEELRRRAADNDGARVRLQDDLDATRKECEQLQRENSAYRRDVAQWAVLKAKMERESNARDAELALLQSRYAQLQAGDDAPRHSPHAARADAEVTQLRAALDRAQAEVKELKGRGDKYKRKALEALRMADQAMDASAKESRDTGRERECKRCDRSNATQLELREELAHLHARERELVDIVRDREHHIARLEMHLDAAEAEVCGRERIVAQLRGDVEVLQRQVVRAEDTCLQLRKEKQDEEKKGVERLCALVSEHAEAMHKETQKRSPSSCRGSSDFCRLEADLRKREEEVSQREQRVERRAMRVKALVEQVKGAVAAIAKADGKKSGKNKISGSIFSFSSGKGDKRHEDGREKSAKRAGSKGKVVGAGSVAYDNPARHYSHGSPTPPSPACCCSSYACSVPPACPLPLSDSFSSEDGADTTIDILHTHRGGPGSYLHTHAHVHAHATTLSRPSSRSSRAPQNENFSESPKYSQPEYTLHSHLSTSFQALAPTHTFDAVSHAPTRPSSRPRAPSSSRAPPPSSARVANAPTARPCAATHSTRAPSAPSLSSASSSSSPSPPRARTRSQARPASTLTTTTTIDISARARPSSQHRHVHVHAHAHPDQHRTRSRSRPSSVRSLPSQPSSFPSEPSANGDTLTALRGNLRKAADFHPTRPLPPHMHTRERIALPQAPAPETSRTRAPWGCYAETVNRDVPKPTHQHRHSHFPTPF